MRRAKREDKFPENGFEQWGGYMNAKKAKLEEQFKAGASKESHLQTTSKIFSGISVYVNGYTIPTADEIKMAMMLHGGQFHQYYSASKTRFIIASNLADAKLKKIKGQPKVVKPQWIADCVAAEKLLDFRPYLLYSNQSKTQPKIQFPQVSEFESPVNSHRYKKLEISIGQTLTSTPKVGRKRAALDTTDKSPFNDSTASAISAEEEKVMLESDDSKSSSSSDFNLFSELKLNKKKTSPFEVVTNFPDDEEKDPSVSNEESDFEDLLDCTLVAEELRAAEQAALKKTELPLKETVTLPKKETPTPKEDNIFISTPKVEVKIPQSTAAKPKETAPPPKEPEPQSKKAPMKRAGEENFLSEFYSNSRLHHISTMGTAFKAYVNDLRRNHSGDFPGRQKLLQWKREAGIDGHGWSGGVVVMHIDMDCFFVSVGLRAHPELRGQPVAVTHAKGNPPPTANSSSREAEFQMYRKRMQNKAGTSKSTEHFAEALEKRLSWRGDGGEASSMSEIASCNYEARAAGLRNGMFLGEALRLCPNLKTIAYDFDAYKEVSTALYDTLASLTLDIEAVSCDEMFVDCTRLLAETDTRPLDFATFVRAEIKKITGCPASTGFGANMLQARMATKKAKPDGQFHLLPEDVVEFVKNIKVSDLPGVGRNVAYRLQAIGVQTCNDLQKTSLALLQEHFGAKVGLSLHKHSRGEDDRKLELEHVRKSVSAEVNYGVRFSNLAECRRFVEELSAEVQRRLEAAEKQGRCVTLKLMVKAKDAPERTAKFMGHGVCDSFSRSVTLPAETSDAKIIAREAMKLVDLLGINFSLFRGMGVQMSKLSDKKKADTGMSRFLQKGKPPSSVASTSRAEPKASTSRAEPVASTSRAEPEVLDEAVLAELPEDIRQEVLREYKLARPPSASSSKSFAAELTMSQVDPSFLEALPDDLKREVVAELQASKTRRGDSKLLFPALTSPRKSKVSPKKKKRGRPIGGAKRKPIIKVPRRENSPPAKPEVQTKFTHQKYFTISWSQVVPEVKVEEEKDEGPLQVSMKVEDLLPLIKEWVKSSAEPVEQDTELMIQFLEKLLLSGKVDKIAAVLRTLKLNVTRKGSAAWRGIFEGLIEKTQHLVFNRYGSKLMF
ncbi:DNA repair protein Rev1 isoform X1 [Cloeon dipterum]|uniref:DNA repair protein Rev1 isoform X1 n=1 Tax=Cloeon dipterum TaxID=197152 RepID=UPI00321FCBFE